MKRALVALTLLVCSAAANAQLLDPTANLKNYAAKLLPRCPGATISLDRIEESSAPANFTPYAVTLRSADKYCGAQKHLIHSPKTQQVLVGTVIALPADSRPANVRIAEKASELLRKKMNATIAPFPLPDGLKAVSITRETPYGAFSYGGYLDAKETFLIVGHRGTLGSDPAKALREALGVPNAARRGNAAAKVEIIELSDFQCPTCARAHETMEPLIRKNLSKINYVRIDLPLFENHQWAVPAAMGARAIQRVAPAKYWDYVDYVFKNQEEIGKRPFDQVIKEFAADHEINWPAIQKIYASKSERQALLDQVSRAFAAGLASTPTFIVNGQIMGFGPDGAFTMDAIKDAIGK